MKNFAICALFAAGVSAIPMAAPKHAHQHQHKRDVVWVTETDVDVVTIPVTKTVWVDGATAQANVRPTGSHYTKTVGSSATSAATSESASSSSTSESSAPAAPESTSSSSVYVAPTTPAYVAPTTSSTSEYVAPTLSSTSEYVAPTPTSTYVAPSTTSSSAAAASTTASSGSGGSYSGDLTYYDVGLGSCGETNVDSDMVVALAADMMDKATDCGRSISISYGGVTADATIVDTCPGCSGGGLDLSPSLFVKFAPTASGRLTQATWSFN